MTRKFRLMSIFQQKRTQKQCSRKKISLRAIRRITYSYSCGWTLRKLSNTYIFLQTSCGWILRKLSNTYLLKNYHRKVLIYWFQFFLQHVFQCIFNMLNWFFLLWEYIIEKKKSCEGNLKTIKKSFHVLNYFYYRTRLIDWCTYQRQ